MSVEKNRLAKDFSEYESKNNNFKEKVGNFVVNPPASKYDINVLRFPNTLGTDPSLQHYVSFFINVRGKSKFNQNRLFRVVSNKEAQLSSDQLASATTGITTIAGAAVGASLASMSLKKIAGAAKNTGAKIADTGVKVAGAVVGAGIGGEIGKAVNSSNLLKPDVSERISDVITLHLEEKPSVKYSAQYANKDLGTLAGFLGQTGGGDLLDIIKTGGQMSGELASAALMTLAKLPSMFSGVDVKSIFSAQGKVALNPFREVLFESIDFRSFSFKYRLMPKNKKETEDIHRIIKLFKFHMHPELSQNKLFFIYPAEFEIAYYYRDKINQYFHKFTPSVLTDLQVDYGGEQFTSFKDGSPGEVNLQLTFRETEILTKEKINQGY